MHMDHIHGLQELFVFGLVTQGKIKARICQRHTRASDDAWFVILVFQIAKGENMDFVSGGFERLFVQGNIVCYAADVRFIGVCHHSDFHKSIVQCGADNCQDAYGRMTRIGVELVKLVLRNKEYEVRPGMNLQAALKKCDIVPESVIATRDGEMILDDEILKDGDVVKLVAVISGGVI